MGLVHMASPYSLPAPDLSEFSLSRSQLFSMVRAHAADPSAHAPPPAHLLAAAREAEARDNVDQAIAEEEAAIASAQARIRTLYTRRNLNVPVSRLPHELLAAVFILLRDTSTSSAYWHVILGVCTAWRAVAVHCPRLWSRVDVGSTSQEWTELLLKRSHNTPLDLRISLKIPRSWEETPEQAHGSCMTALSALPRTRHLSLVLPPHLSDPHREWALQNLAVSSSTLQSLVVDNMTAKGYIVVTPLPSGACVGDNATQLKELELRNCLLPLNAANVCNTLSRLHLSYGRSTTMRMRHSPAQFTELMSSLGQIEELTLSFALVPLPEGVQVHVSNLKVIRLMDHLPLAQDFMSRLQTTLTVRTGLVVDVTYVMVNRTQDPVAGIPAFARLFHQETDGDDKPTHEIESVRMAYITDYPNAFYLFQGWADPSLGVATADPHVKLTIVFADQSPEFIGPLTLGLTTSLPLGFVSALHMEWLNPIEMNDWRTILTALSGVRILSAYESPAARLTAVLREDAIDAAASAPNIRLPLLPLLGKFIIDQAALVAMYPCSPTGKAFWQDLSAFVAARAAGRAPLACLTLVRARREDAQVKAELESQGVRVDWGVEADSFNKLFHERRLQTRQQARELRGPDDEDYGF